MKNSKIEWCDHTVNLWWGCFEVHAGCDNCYAKTQANRYHGPDFLWKQKGPRMYVKSAFSDIRKYQKEAAAANKTYKIFMNSMSDIFEKSMPLVNFKHESMLQSLYSTTEDIRELFFEIVEECPNLFFILLTKRPSNIMYMIPGHWVTHPPKNVIYMTSVVDQATAETLIPQLLELPGKKGLSMEPLISHVDLNREMGPYTKGNYSALRSSWLMKLDWVIVGGESGHHARGMNLAWALDLKRQCKDANVPFFFKQDSAANNKNYKDQNTFPADLLTRDFPILTA